MTRLDQRDLVIAYANEYTTMGAYPITKTGWSRCIAAELALAGFENPDAGALIEIMALLGLPSGCHYTARVGPDLPLDLLPIREDAPTYLHRLYQEGFDRFATVEHRNELLGYIVRRKRA
jgi:hypothetical protein